MLREVMQDAARRADGGGAIFQAEAIERRDLEMIAHGEERGFRREHPIFVAVENPAEPFGASMTSAVDAKVSSPWTASRLQLRWHRSSG